MGNPTRQEEEEERLQERVMTSEIRKHLDGLDMVKKKRMRGGKLTEEQFAELARRYVDGVHVSVLSSDYEMSAAAIRTILSNAGIRRGKKDNTPSQPNPDAIRVESEGREQSHRENLIWALEAAGKYLRVGEYPEMCPNDAAFFLFCRAIEDPKDLMARVTQIESKKHDRKDRHEQQCKKSIEEIDCILAELTEGADGGGEGSEEADSIRASRSEEGCGES